jgi:dihydroneopterin aldolase
MRDSIEIHGIAGFGYHGLFEHERKHGQSFTVDVKLELKSRRAGKSDDISDAVDYGVVVRIVHEFIELLNTFAIKSVEVVVHKANAPVGFPVGDIAVRIKRSK